MNRNLVPTVMGNGPVTEEAFFGAIDVWAESWIAVYGKLPDFVAFWDVIE